MQRSSYFTLREYIGAVRWMLDGLRSTLLKQRGRNWTAEIDKALSALEQRYGNRDMDWYLWAALEAVEVDPEDIAYVHYWTAKALGWDDFYNILVSIPQAEAAVETIEDLRDRLNLLKFRQVLGTYLDRYAGFSGPGKARDKVEEVLDAPIRYEDVIS